MFFKNWERLRTTEITPTKASTAATGLDFALDNTSKSKDDCSASLGAPTSVSGPELYECETPLVVVVVEEPPDEDVPVVVVVVVEEPPDE